MADGDYYLMECALRSDKSSIVDSFLNDLELGKWNPKIGRKLPQDEQVSMFAWVLAACDHFANYGDFPGAKDHNQLREGIWEIKHFNIRISFYDTDGRGGYNPKIDLSGISNWGDPPRLPEFDDQIRLGTAFCKNSKKTEPRDIHLAQVVRDEDLNHDRPH